MVNLSLWGYIFLIKGCDNFTFYHPPLLAYFGDDSLTMMRLYQDSFFLCLLAVLQENNSSVNIKQCNNI